MAGSDHSDSDSDSDSESDHSTRELNLDGHDCGMDYEFPPEDDTADAAASTAALIASPAALIASPASAAVATSSPAAKSTSVLSLSDLSELLRETLGEFFTMKISTTVAVDLGRILAEDLTADLRTDIGGHVSYVKRHLQHYLHRFIPAFLHGQLNDSLRAFFASESAIYRGTDAVGAQLLDDVGILLSFDIADTVAGDLGPSLAEFITEWVSELLELYPDDYLGQFFQEELHEWSCTQVQAYVEDFLRDYFANVNLPDLI